MLWHPVCVGNPAAAAVAADMPKLTVLPHAELAPDGAVLDVTPGTSICEALLENGIEIDHACDQSCACTTCRCIVRSGFESLNALEECEDDLLDRAWGLEAQSRLSCQAIVGSDDLTVAIPKYTVNHAKESH
jgi:2Fe-2S ferredoxin